MRNYKDKLECAREMYGKPVLTEGPESELSDMESIILSGCDTEDFKELNFDRRI
ncbi:MAG: hypothetical protein Q8P15_00350 [Nanoarchaeota archaeon]|nr:hypothetical protein [Nanoarchaeota archaeon]